MATSNRLRLFVSRSGRRETGSCWEQGYFHLSGNLPGVETSLRKSCQGFDILGLADLVCLCR